MLFLSNSGVSLEALVGVRQSLTRPCGLKGFRHLFPKEAYAGSIPVMDTVLFFICNIFAI